MAFFWVRVALMRALVRSSSEAVVIRPSLSPASRTVVPSWVMP